MAKEIIETLELYLEEKKDFHYLPPFYKKLEIYKDDNSVEYSIENLNVTESFFHQTKKCTVGYSYKRTANILLNSEKIIHKQIN
jgi:hypothetical protein